MYQKKGNPINSFYSVQRFNSAKRIAQIEHPEILQGTKSFDIRKGRIENKELKK